MLFETSSGLSIFYKGHRGVFKSPTHKMGILLALHASRGFFLEVEATSPHVQSVEV